MDERSDDNARTTRVLVVDDHRTFADLLALALGAQPDLESVGIAINADEALAMTLRQQPDVVVMDVRLGNGDGLQVTSQLIAAIPALCVVVLTAHASQGLLERAAGVGACCLLPKDGSLPEVLDAIRTARPGRFVVHPVLMQELVSGRRSSTTPHPQLTHREISVLYMLADGLDAPSISRDLGISLYTCRGHVRSLLHKLNAHSQLEAVANAKRAGLLNRFNSG